MEHTKTDVAVFLLFFCLHHFLTKVVLKVCLWCFSFVSLMLRDQLWHAAGTPSFSDHEALLFASTLSSALCDCDSNLACMLVQRLIDISGAKTD